MMNRMILSIGFVLWFSIQVTAQVSTVTVSGDIKDSLTQQPLAFVQVVIKNLHNKNFVSGTISNEEGFFIISGLKPGRYLIEFLLSSYFSKTEDIFIGTLSEYLSIPTAQLKPNIKLLSEVVVQTRQEDLSNKMDKKTISIASNITQSGASVLQVLQNQPGVSVQDGKLLIRGNDKITVLLDGKQTALTGFGSQTNLDNIPASAIDKIEIINNPSAKYDANGNAGIINIIYKKNKTEGFNGKFGFATGLGALWQKKENLPNIRPQFVATPKVNPSLSLNYRKKKVNLFFQGDYYYNPTLNKNEFVTRTYSANDSVIQQQTKRNRKTTFTTFRTGFDWNINNQNSFTASALYSHEKILDDGDQPFFNKDFSKRNRLWQFLEDEVKTTFTASSAFQHKFKQAGHLLNVSFNYTFHREDEKYFFTNTMPTYVGYDSFKLLSDEHVTDLMIDYIKPLKYGKIETGLKYRWRNIPTNMLFKPGQNSPLDVNAGGSAVYKENIPAIYTNYSYEDEKVELEAGIRFEYVKVKYDVDPNHNTYKSDGYEYTQPFPNVRLGYKFNENNKLSFFFNRRVDRPNEFDIRVFPKYDDAEIIKVGNPALKPQFTNTFEVGYKTNTDKGYVYTALYHKKASGTITRIGSIVSGSTIIYNVMQNAGDSYNTGVEVVYSKKVNNSFSYNLNANGYQNQINAFTVKNIYPSPNTYTSSTEKMICYIPF